MMKKRVRRLTALLMGCLVLTNGVNVFAKECISQLGDNTYISISVSKSTIYGRTLADNSRTTVGGSRYPSAGSPSQLIDMGKAYGQDIASLSAPSGWSIAKGTSFHTHGGFTATLYATP